MRTKTIRALSLGALFVLASTALTGCSKYDKPEFVEIGPSETAFLVPVEGQTSAQKGFGSEAYLKKLQVATKRIQIPHRWVKEGRGIRNGRYLDTERVIKVDRKAVVREWTTGEGTGTSKADQGIRAESKESIAFATGMTCAAMIREEDAAKYLYWYGKKPLSDVMDQEILGRIKKCFVQQAAHYTLVNDELAQNKDTIMKVVEKDVTDYFKDKGITITVLGLQGDFQYEPSVQESINLRFTAAQDRVAQGEINTKIKEKAIAEAAAARSLALTKNLGNQIRLRELDNERLALENQAKSIDKWTGGTPETLYIMGGGREQPVFTMPYTKSQGKALPAK